MGRALLALLCLAPAVGLFLNPPRDPVLAAAEAAWPARAGDSPGHLELFRALLESPAARAEGGGHVLRLGGVRFATDRPTSDLNTHVAARDALARGLERTAAELGQALVIEGGFLPVDGGADFLVEQRGGELTVIATHPEVGEIARASRPTPRESAPLGRPLWLWLAALATPLCGWTLLAKRRAAPDAGR